MVALRARHASLTLVLALACTAPPSTPDASQAADAQSRDGGVPLDSRPDAFVTAVDGGGDAHRDDDAGTDASSACPARPSIGLFVWTDELVDTQDQILDLAEAHEVTEIYLHANLFYAGGVDEDLLAAWITDANARCIEVELLFGNALWMLPANRSEATDRTAWAVAFAESHPAARPSGIHWDLEPQQLAAWRADDTTHPGFVSDLVDTLEAMTPVAEAGGLPLSNDIGFFLDGIDVTRGGVTRPGSEWVTDAVSRIVIMDYRDSALSTGFGGMISLAEAEVTYASSVGVPVVIAAETTVQDPEYITFAEEGLAAMLVELGLVRTHFESASAFTGMALHDSDGLAALDP